MVALPPLARTGGGVVVTRGERYGQGGGGGDLTGKVETKEEGGVVTLPSLGRIRGGGWSPVPPLICFGRKVRNSPIFASLIGRRVCETLQIIGLPLMLFSFLFQQGDCLTLNSGSPTKRLF